MKRAELVAFTQQFPRDGANSPDYESCPWLQYPPSGETARLLEDFGCELFDIYRPVRDARLVMSELSELRVSLRESGLVEHLCCCLCSGLCRETMTVKDCSHRFCSQCITRSLRLGKQHCPLCFSKIPSRRCLRPDEALDTIIKRLFADAEAMNKFDKDRKKPDSHHPSREDSMEFSSPEDDDDAEIESIEVADTSSSEELLEDGEEEDEEDDEEEEEDEDTDRHQRKHQRRRPGRRSQRAMCAMDEPRSISPMDELYADDNGTLEIFLVCSNPNLPSAVCSMARELSKRPMKLPMGATTRDAAMILAEKLVQDVLGPFDVHSIIPDLSFVRDGEIWPAITAVPLSEVCRQVTESRGPIALRYLLSERLFSLCERIETSY